MQPNAAGELPNIDNPTLQAEEEDGALTLVGGDVSINDLIEALNQLGVKPRDLGQILQAIKASGAMQAFGGYMSAIDPLAIGRIMNSNLGDTQRQEIASEELRLPYWDADQRDAKDYTGWNVLFVGDGHLHGNDGPGFG